MATFPIGYWTSKTPPRTKHLLRTLESLPASSRAAELNPNLDINDTTTRGQITRQLISRDGDNCYLCRRSLTADYELEHIIPRSRGGDNTLANLGLACQSCNRHKHTNIVSIRIKDRIPCYWIGT